LREELERFIPEERVLHRPIDLIAFPSDASFYRLIPKAVVLASITDEIKELFRYSRKRNIPLVFRASGTSLSGQSITDGILVEIKRYWNSVKVEENGKKVRVRSWRRASSFAPRAVPVAKSARCARAAVPGRRRALLAGQSSRGRPRPTGTRTPTASIVEGCWPSYARSHTKAKRA
jgi:FAD binding domain